MVLAHEKLNAINLLLIFCARASRPFGLVHHLLSNALPAEIRPRHSPLEVTLALAGVGWRARVRAWYQHSQWKASLPHAEQIEIERARWAGEEGKLKMID